MSDTCPISGGTERKRRTALLAFGLAALFVLLKGWAAWVSGSVGVLSMAAEACLDMVSALFTYFVVGAADRPPDDDHPYGHGKYEQGAALFQAGLMFFMAAGLLFEALRRWFGDEPLKNPGAGVAVLCVTGAVGLAWGLYVRRNAEGGASPALAAYGRMVVADSVTDGAVIAVLLLCSWTDMRLWDILVSLVVALYIASEGFQSARLAWRDLSDHRLPPEEEARIRDIVLDYPQARDIHDLRTRASGPYRLVDFHVSFCRSLTLGEAHFIAERIRKRVEEDYSRSDVLIHIDTCGGCKNRETCHTWPKLDPAGRERVSIVNALTNSSGDLPTAAAFLELPENELAERIDALGIDRDFFIDPRKSAYGSGPADPASKK